MGAEHAIAPTSKQAVEVHVSFRGDEYVAQAEGRIATCTWAASEATRRLAAKLGFRDGDFDVLLVGRYESGEQLWLIMVLQG